MSREHDKEIIYYSFETVVDDLDKICANAVDAKMTFEELIDKLTAYSKSLHRVAKIIKGD